MQLIEVATNDPLKRRVLLHLVDATDGITPETGENGVKCKVSLNYAAHTDSRNGIVAYNQTDAPGDYYLELTSQEIQFPGMITVRYKSANTAHFVQEAQVVAFNPDTWRGPLVGNGGPDIDYKRIARIVADNMNLLPLPKEPETVDLTPIQTQLSRLQNAINNIDIPEQKTTDFTPLMEEFARLEAQVSSLKFPETDMQPVLAAIEHFEQMNVTGLDNAQQIGELMNKIRHFFELDIEEVKDGVSTVNKKLDDMPYVVIEKRKETINENTDDGL